MIKKIISILTCAVISLSLCACAGEGKGESVNGNVVMNNDLAVVVDGKSDYKIVYPDKASECVEFAANELSTFIEESTGCKIEVVTDKDLQVAKYSRFISVGETSLWKDFEYTADLDELNYDGFRILFNNNVICISGARDRGTLYGVYDFLERYIGVKFYTADYTYVPKIESVSVPKKDITEIPAFQLRSYYSGDIFDDPLFAARSRMVAFAGDEIAEYGYNIKYDFEDPIHNSIYLLTTDYFNEHPEFYMEENGIRTPKDICWSNGIKDDGTLDEDMELSTVKIVIEAVKQMAIDNPTARYFMIGQMDTTNTYCRCDTCNRIKTKYGLNYSANLIRFLNVVAREMKKWGEENGREINMVTFAYTYSEQPPVEREPDGSFSRVDDQVVCEDNLYVRIATANGNLYYANNDPRQTAYANTFNGWASICDNFMIWDYVTNFREFHTYIPCFRTLVDNYRYYRDIGVEYVMSQAEYVENDSWQAKVKTWIASKLMWNPDLELSALLDEFLVGYYGKYAPSVKEMIDIYEDRISFFLSSDEFRPSMVMGGIGTHMHFKYSSWPIQILERAENIMQKAVDAVDTDAELSEDEKLAMKKRLVTVLVTPKRMIWQNYKSYYGEEGYEGYRAELESLFNFVDITKTGEGFYEI